MSNNQYDLWLDDMRIPPRPGGVTIIWCKSMLEFTRTIETRGLPRVISFDHDLCDAHYNHDYSDCATGLDCANWLMSYCVDRKLAFPLWRVHSMNVMRGQQMKDSMLRFSPETYNVKQVIGAP